LVCVPATIVIGDVHGCADELTALLAVCAAGRDDRVVLVGDLVAKGPDSRGVLALVRETGARSVLGNHDAVVLRACEALAAGKTPTTRPGHTALARELSDDDVALLASLPLYLRLPELSALIVHAGVVPGVPLERQERDVLLNVRTIDAAGKPSSKPDGGVLWGSVWPGPELVVFGHHASMGLQRHPHAIGLDTGCVYGGRLTAYVMPEGRFVSVPARRPYVPIRGDRA
jgi:hypothetical protein